MSSEPVKFLIVDDIEDNLTVLEALLRRDGLQILQARSGAEALELLLVHEVALALLDVQMPDMDGFETARLIKGRERTRLVPIIFLTAISHEHHHHLAGYEVGGVDYVTKPFNPLHLAPLVNDLLERVERGDVQERRRERLAELRQLLVSD